MQVKYIKEDKQLIFKIDEEIDHHSSEKIRKRADYEIQVHIPKKLIFDFENVTFMDSSGIGMLIGSLAFICEENRELKRQLKDVQTTVKMLDEELQEVYRVE